MRQVLVPVAIIIIVLLIGLAAPFVQTAFLQDAQITATATFTPTPTATATIINVPLTQAPPDAPLATAIPLIDAAMTTSAGAVVQPTIDPVLLNVAATIDPLLTTVIPTSALNVLVPTVDPLLITPIPTLDPMLLVPTVDPLSATTIPTVDPLALTPIPTLDPMLLAPTADPLLASSMPTLDVMVATPLPGDAMAATETMVTPLPADASSSQAVSTVSGRVDSAATDSVLVIVSDQSGQVVASTVTNPDGSFAVELPIHGEYVVTFDDGVSLRESQPISADGGNPITTEARTLVWGDLNRDMVIDELDIVTLASVYGQPADPNGIIDLNRDGLIGLWELFMMAVNYGESVTPTA